MSSKASTVITNTRFMGIISWFRYIPEAARLSR
jgi:hypothetical protein